jgi:hypothetical protein
LRLDVERHPRSLLDAEPVVFGMERVRQTARRVVFQHFAGDDRFAIPAEGAPHAHFPVGSHAIAEPKAFGGLQVDEGREPFSGIEAI